MSFYRTTIIEEFHNIGLTEGEIKVYRALLDLGEATKTSLAKRSEISPSNIYDVTNRLFEKGLISKVEKNNVMHFSAANPNRLLDFLETKEKEIKKERDIVNQVLPSLFAKFKETKQPLSIQVFQGWDGMQTVWDDMLAECKKGDYNYAFGASVGESATEADRFFLKNSIKREKEGIKLKIIFNEEVRSRKSRIDFFLKSKSTENRFLAQSTPTEIVIYNDVTWIMILTKSPVVIRIISKEVRDSFFEYFKVLWAQSTP